MEYVRLGKTNLLISRVALGAFRLVDSKSEKIEDEAAQIVRKAYDEGINFYDASRKIENSEKLLGDALYDIKKMFLFLQQHLPELFLKLKVI